LDRDEERIRELNSGRVAVYEPGLEELVSRSVERKKLSFAGSEGLVRLVAGQR